jgi:hypothetical protein
VLRWCSNQYWLHSPVKHCGLSSRRSRVQIPAGALLCNFNGWASRRYNVASGHHGAIWDELYTDPTKEFDTALWPVAFLTNAINYAIAGEIAASVSAWLVISGRMEEKAKLSAVIIRHVAEKRYGIEWGTPNPFAECRDDRVCLPYFFASQTPPWCLLLPRIWTSIYPVTLPIFRP